VKTSEASLLAEIFEAAAAEITNAARGMQPRHSNTIANRKLNPRTKCINNANDLMSGNNREMRRIDVTFNDMQIGVANATIADPDADLSRGRAWCETVFRDKR
jgi:hypothetical protein